MSDLIDRDALLNEFAGTGFLHESVICYAIANAPTVLVDNVIRCIECDHYTRSPFGHRKIGWCKLDGKHRGQNFFCAHADKK